jgi:hypothetical protein
VIVDAPGVGDVNKFQVSRCVVQGIASEVAKGSEWDSLKGIFLKKNPFEPPFFRNPAVRMVRVRTQASFVHRAGHQGIQNRGVS